jgi:hypothetical protein
MSDYDKNTKRRVNGVPAIPTTIDANLQQYLRQLNELLEGSVGIRGNALDRNVTVRELVDAGVAESPEKNAKYVPNAVNAQNRGFVGTGRMRMFTSQREKTFRSSTHTFAHGLGRIPDLVQLRAICTAADGDTYEPGDIVVLPGSTTDPDGNDEGGTIIVTTEEVKLFFAANGIGLVVERDGTGGLDVLNDQTEANSRWDIEVKAFVFDTATQGN